MRGEKITKRIAAKSRTKRSTKPIQKAPENWLSGRVAGLSTPQRNWLSAAAYLAAWAIASWVFYLRFPNAYHQPNFYAEDGVVFARNLLNKDFVHAIGTSFNGYYVWGVYIMEKIGFIINSLFYHGELVNLARSFAIVSYVSFGFVATLPVLLLRNRIRPLALLLATVLLMFIPMPGSEYAIVGVVSDLKFGFVFVAFCLLLYRHNAKENSLLIPLVDIGLLVCVYTNTTVYLLLPFALLRYWPKIKAKDRWRQLQSDRSFRSLVVLGLASLPQLYFIKRDGIDPQPGYLDTPFKSASTVELFFARSFLFGFLAPIYKSLNNATVILIMLFITVTGWWSSGRRYQNYFLFGWFTVLATTLLFVWKRPGVSDFHIGYHSGGFDQFFYAQNWIFDLVLAIAFVELVSKLKWMSAKLAVYCSVGYFLIVALIPNASAYGKNVAMQNNVGNIYAVSQKACRLSGDKLTIPVYPTPDQKLANVPRQQLCTPSAINFQQTDFIADFGLKATDNSYFEGLGINNFFAQTFVSPESGLNGLNVYFSTFGAQVKSPYSLTLYQADCKSQIVVVPIRTKRIKDNALFAIKLPKQNDSARKTYCFSVASTTKTNVSHLAVQLSLPNVYPEGEAKINGVASDRDIVFQPHYR